MLVIMLVIIALSTLTASLFKNSKPEMRTIPFPGLLLIFIVSSSMPENCSVAPRRESIREPSRPAAKHKGITRGLVTAVSCSPFERLDAKNYTIPIPAPPATLAINPRELTPPFVPLLTGFRVVINMGSFELKTPISLLHVSPQQQL